MATVGVHHHGLLILPEVFDRSVRDMPLRPLRKRYGAILAAVLLPMPLAALFLGFFAIPGHRVHDPFAHGLLEGFCALVALVLVYVLRQEWLDSGNRRLGVMAHGFLIYGILNLLHALAPHGSHGFVFLHSIAGLAGAIVFWASVMDFPSVMNSLAPSGAQARRITAAVAVGALALGILGYGISESISLLSEDGSFSIVALAINVLAAGFFFMTGISFLSDFRRCREPILFILALGMFVFTETYAMFSISNLWDVPWWGWHVLKAAVSLGILIGIGYECSQTLRDLLASNRKLSESLGALEERNRDLQAAYRQLASAQASLVKAERWAALGQMAGVVAHEIRNPLGTIANCLGMLARPAISPAERSKALGLAEQNVDRLNQIVADTLSASRAEVVRREPVSLLRLVDDVLAGFSLGHNERLRLDLEIEPGLPYIDASPQQIRQVIWNLVANAMDAMKGEGRLALRIARAGDFVVIRVSDSGPGIPEALREKVFEPLFTTKAEGTGLGLSIVRGIVTEHGGTVEVEEGSRIGASIAVRLPVIVERPRAAAVRAGE
jgi:signal transduction histidine kinase